MPENQSSQYTAISVHKDDKAFYEQIAKELSEERGVKVSVPQAIKIGITAYNQRRKSRKQKDQ